ncbi:MAG: hypothetical protein ACN4GW_14655 [Desulforhopalus sp.]
MAKIALVANSSESRSKYLENTLLPTFYMEDFSILGLQVERYEEACALLLNKGYTVINFEGGSDIHLDHPGQISTIMTTLLQHDIDTVLSDIADTLYQA